MNDALEKTLILLSLMALGFALKTKVKSADQINGIKEIVLTVALPSMIFIALMNIEIDSTMLIVPLLTVAFNFFIFALTPLVLPLFGVEKESSTGRTLTLLMPSLAPGLSCFPFVTEFLGEKSVAIGALADVGNKFFVLIFLYIVALNMFLKTTKSKEQKIASKLKGLFLSLVQEPINIIILLAFILLSLDFNYASMPVVLQGVLEKTSSMMTPLILIYIGLAVRLKKGLKRVILSILSFRAGVTLLFSTALILLLKMDDPVLMLIVLAIPQSSVSFWPFAHISLFNKKETDLGIPEEKRTFNTEQAILTLAFSLPFSTLIILAILSAGETFLNPLVSIGVGISLIAAGILFNLFFKISELKAGSLAKN